MGKKVDAIINIAAAVYGVSSAIFSDKTVKPEWLINYEKNQWEIKRKTGMSDTEIKKLFNVLIEFNVLENEGKKIY